MSQAGFGNGCGCTAAVPDTTCTNTECINKQTFNIEVDIWDDPGCDGDNVVRVFNKGEIVYIDGYFYVSQSDLNIGMPPTGDWSNPFTQSELLTPVAASELGLDINGDPVMGGSCLVTCATLEAALALVTSITSTTQIAVSVNGTAIVGGDCLATCQDLQDALNAVTVDACSVTSMDQAGVDAATSVEVIACVDGSTVKIPMGSGGTTTPCSDLLIYQGEVSTAPAGGVTVNLNQSALDWPFTTIGLNFGVVGDNTTVCIDSSLLVNGFTSFGTLPDETVFTLSADGMQLTVESTGSAGSDNVLLGVQGSCAC